MFDKRPIISSSPVIIQDIVVASTIHHSKQGAFSGEFGNDHADQRTLQIRLFKLIKDIIERVVYKHKQRTHDKENRVKTDKLNNITRVITNEFLFYSNHPLTLTEFASLQEKILNLAKKQPKNVHLMFATFAVKNSNDKIMNVAAYIECGEDPQIQFIVKNYPCAIDPVYSQIKNGEKIPLYNVHKDQDPLKDAITIGGKRYAFTYDPIVESKTLGGEPFFSGFDIGNDHLKGVAKTAFEQRISNSVVQLNKGERSQLIPTQCSQGLVSSGIKIEQRNTFGNVTHADPLYSTHECKSGVSRLKIYSMPTSFGSSITVIPTTPVCCDELPSNELKVVNEVNQKWIEVNGNDPLQKNQSILFAKSASNTVSRIDPKSWVKESNTLSAKKFK